MKRLATSFFILSFCFVSALAQTPTTQTPTKPQATAPEGVTLGMPKYPSKAERDAEKKKSVACKKQAKDHKLSGKERRVFVRDCMAK